MLKVLYLKHFFNNFCFSQNISVSQIPLCTFLLSYLIPLHISNSIFFPLLYHPLIIPHMPKTIFWHPRPYKKQGNDSPSLPISHVRSLYHEPAVLIVHLLKYPRHSPVYLQLHSSLRVHWCFPGYLTSWFFIVLGSLLIQLVFSFLLMQFIT